MWIVDRSRSNPDVGETIKIRNKALGQAVEPLTINRLTSELEGQLSAFLEYTDEFLTAMESSHPLYVPNPHGRMSVELLRRHLSSKTTQPSLLIEISGVPYATATRRLAELIESGLIIRRQKTRSGRSFTLHPSDQLIDTWIKLMKNNGAVLSQMFKMDENEANDRFFGSTYAVSKNAPPMSVLDKPLTLSGGLKTLIHSDPSFMVMNKLKRHFEMVLGCPIHNETHSLDTLRDETLKNSDRKRSAYDLVAVNLPWVGEYVTKGLLTPLDELIDIEKLDTSDFHQVSWEACHWDGRCYGIPIETTSEVLMYRSDLFQDAGLLPPTTTRELLLAARALHDPSKNLYGIGWNAARGTPLGHTFLMAMADFGQPVVDLPSNATGFDVGSIASLEYKPVINSIAGLQAAKFLQELLNYSPPNILSMSWFERIKGYTEGRTAMVYSYTQMTPYFEESDTSPARGQTGYLPHPAGSMAHPVSPVGGFMLGVPSNLHERRIPEVVTALESITSARAQRLYVQNGSRGCSRYSANDDPGARAKSGVIEAIDNLARRGALQSWPRPPIPEINSITEVCGNVMHEMLRGLITPEEALIRAQSAAEDIINNSRQK